MYITSMSSPETIKGPERNYNFLADQINSLIIGKVTSLIHLLRITDV